MPFKWNNYKYDTSVYAPMMTGNRLSPQDVQAFLDRLEKAADNYKQMKWTCMSTIKLLIAIAVVMGLFIASIMYMATTSQTNNERKVFKGIGGVFLCTFLYIFLILRYVRNRVATVKRIRDKMNQVIVESNSFYEAMGLRWRLPPDHFRWIELWLDFKFASGDQQFYPTNTNVGVNTNMNNQGYQAPNYFPQQQGYNVPQNNNTGNNKPLYPTF